VLSSSGVLEGRIAIVTGSTSGIGEAIAREFAAEGAKVVVSGRRVERGNKVVAAIREAGGEAIFVQTDVTKPEQIKSLVDKAYDHYGRIDILVNNAAVGFNKLIADYTLEDFESLIGSNLRSYFMASVYALQYMVKQQKGVILNINSITQKHPVPERGLYAMCKGAIRVMTQSIALEYGPQGIRCNDLTPGIIHTELFDKVPNGHEEMASVSTITPLRRVGQPWECAKAALYLVSDNAGFTTGAQLIMDGGITI